MKCPSKMEVSVIITAYKQKEFIRSCVSSALLNDIPVKVIVVVDDGQNYDILKDMPITIISTKKCGTGPSSARNLGYQYVSNNEYVLFLDGDDYLLPHALDNSISIAKEHRYVMLNLKFKTNLNGLRRIFSNRDQKKIISYDEYLSIRNPSKFLFHSSLIQHPWPKNINFGEDIIFFSQLIKNNHKIAVAPEAEYYYRMHEASITRAIGARKRIINSYNYIIENIDSFLHYFNSTESVKSYIEALKRKNHLNKLFLKSVTITQGGTFQDFLIEKDELRNDVFISG